MSADVLTNPTPVSGGDWVTIGFYQNPLGALNLLTSWSSLATQWVGYLPDTWNTQGLVVNDSFFSKNAVVQVQVPDDTTLGAIATLANNVSPDVSIRSVTDNGGVADGSTLQQQAQDNNPSVNTCLDDPAACLQHLLTEGLVAVGILLGVAALIYFKPWEGVHFKKLVGR